MPDLATLKTKYQQFIRAQLAKRSLKGSLIELPLIAIAAISKPGVAFKAFGLLRRDRKRWLSFIRAAEPVIAYPLMVNQVLRRPGSEPSAGLVLISFDESASQSSELMVNLALRVTSASSRSTDATEREVAALMEDETHVPSRRRRLPNALTGDRAVFACDLWIPPLLLRNHQVDCPLIPCMAEPGERGRINVLPWWIALDRPEPTLPEDACEAGRLGNVFFQSDL